MINFAAKIRLAMHKIIEKPGYELDKTLQELWQVQLDLLEKLIDVCKRHNLRCWVDGGTMLGTVRHKGFIPWDDDIDVAMMREDYDRLGEIAAQEFQHPYFYQTAYSDTDYYRSHAQLRMDGTAAIRPSDCFQPFHQGIFIDIFPMDGIPMDDARVDDALKKSRRILRFLKAKNTNIWASGRVGLIGRKWRARRAIKKRGWSAIYSEAEKLYRQFPVETNKYIGALSFTGKDLVYPKDIYDKTLWLDFEDIQVPVPAGWDTYLTIQYGEDYMIPLMDPTVHGELIIDAHRDYRDVLPEVQKAYSTSALKRLWKKIIK